MSKLTEKLRKVGLSEPAPMGFGSFANRPKQPTMLLLAEVGMDGAAAKKAVADGADALLVGVVGADKDAAVFSQAGDAPVVVTVGEGSVDGVKSLEEAGADSVLLTSLGTSAGVVHVEGPGKFLAVDPDWSDASLRTVEGLPVDGVLLHLTGPLTLETWMRCLRVGGLTRKTLLVALAGIIDSDTLRSLRDAGVSGVIVEPAAVAAARGFVDTMPAQKRQRDHRDAMIPALPRSAPMPSEEEEEEE